MTITSGTWKLFPGSWTSTGGPILLQGESVFLKKPTLDAAQCMPPSPRPPLPPHHQLTEYKWKGSFFGWFVGLFMPVKEIFVLLSCSSRPCSTKYCFPHCTLFEFLCPHRRQPCWVACLLEACVSGYDYINELWIAINTKIVFLEKTLSVCTVRILK